MQAAKAGLLNLTCAFVFVHKGVQTHLSVQTGCATVQRTTEVTPRLYLVSFNEPHQQWLHVILLG